MGARWDGSAWTAIPGDAFNATDPRDASGSSGASRSPALGVDASGRPVAAWADSTPGATDVYLRRYRGAAFTHDETFDDTSFIPRYLFSGDANHSGSSIRLNTFTSGRRGSAFFHRKLLLSSFRARFTLRIDGAADGMSLAMVRGPSLLGNNGGSLGVVPLDGYAFPFIQWLDDRVGFWQTSPKTIFAEGFTPTTLPGTDYEAEVVFQAGRVQVFLESAAISLPRTLVLDHTQGSFPEFEGYLLPRVVSAASTTSTTSASKSTDPALRHHEAQPRSSWPPTQPVTAHTRCRGGACLLPSPRRSTKPTASANLCVETDLQPICESSASSAPRRFMRPGARWIWEVSTAANLFGGLVRSTCAARRAREVPRLGDGAPGRIRPALGTDPRGHCRGLRGCGGRHRDLLGPDPRHIAAPRGRRRAPGHGGGRRASHSCATLRLRLLLSSGRGAALATTLSSGQLPKAQRGGQWPDRPN